VEVFFDTGTGLSQRVFPRVFSTWMYRIALNVAISFARKAGRRSRLAAPLENSDIGSVAGPTKPEPDERIDALYRSLRGLDPFNRALMMLYLDDRSYLEIADVLGISDTNVATKITGSSNTCAASLHRRHDDED
jgi:DNA-directed RNA polymerase specialized sigma24 family protein